ncbi:MAG: hypothetical protein OEY27_08585 [Gammaproteobacteria bacterium]|nr:hypothetical protein [Gammaproteobacteria bacterium]
MRNGGAYDYAARPATVTGVQNGVEMYREILDVSDAVGGGSRYVFPAYLPAMHGEIIWTPMVADDEVDADSATAATMVK